jgi:multisubunit Na+/H+ antiporter MnhE subunit
MIGLIIGLLVLWVILAIVGAAVHVVGWLLWVAIVLFVLTAIWGAVTHGKSRT